MQTISRFFLLVVGLGFLVPAAGPAFAAETFRGRYYVVVFGYQGPGNRPIDSHTFASFYDGDSLENGTAAEPPTISWLPATGVVRPVRREPGHNFTLSQTVGLARMNSVQVRAFGPYEISRELYLRALTQIRYLESGAVLYKMINGPFSGGAINCIHAVSDIVGPLDTGTQRGFAASASVVGHLSRWMYDYPRTSAAVAQRIGLSRIVGGR